MDLRIFTEPQQGAGYDRLATLARAAEGLGFDAFFVSDHYLKMGDADPRHGGTDAMTTLAGLSRDTTTIRLGTMVTAATFRRPGPLAIITNQIDQMSGGRLELGIGAGWYEDEHRAYGIPFPPLGERFDRLEEQLAILTGIWRATDDTPFSWSGKHYVLEGTPAVHRPVQPGGPPIIIGGWGASRTPRLAAQYAAEFNVPFPPLKAFGSRRRAVSAACDAQGRDPATMVFSAAQVLCVGRDDNEVARRAAAIGRDPDELRENGLGGTVDEVAEKIRRFADEGAHRLYLQVLDEDDIDHIALVTEQVRPLLA